MKGFDLNLRDTDGKVNINMSLGYSKCLTHVYNQIAKMTAMKAENRYIDAVELLDIISATNDEVMELMKEAQSDLMEEVKQMRAKNQFPQSINTEAVNQ